MSEIDSGLLNGANLVGGLIAQGHKASDYIDGMFDAHAKKAAGAAIAAGDNGAAASLLGGRGFLDEAQALKDRANASSTLSSLNTKDYAGAKATAAASGDPALFNTASTAEASDKAARVAWMAHAADALLQIKDPAQRHTAYEANIKPTLKAMGLKDDELASISQQSLTDEGLTSFKASLGQMSKLTIHQDPNSGELLGVDPTTGKVTSLHPGSRKPDWKEVKHKAADGSETTTWVDLNDPNSLKDGDSTAAPSTPAPSGAVYDQIQTAAAAAGAKPEEVAYAKRLAQVESSGNPSAKNGSSTGLFQFHPDTFARAGGGNINDVGDQTKAVLTTSRQDRAALQAAGLPTTDANTYIMHQQGPAGGKALLTAPPETNAVSVLTPIYGSAKVATKAIVNNGGSADMSAGDFVKLWQQKWGGAGAKAAGGKSIPGSTTEAPSDDGDLSDLAAEQAAERYVAGAGLPPLGQGKAGTKNRDKVLNLAAKIEQSTGRTGAEAVAAWAGVKANSATLTDLTKMRGKVKSFEDNAIANADLALSLAPKGAAPMNVPIINRWIQTGRRAVAGDPNVTQFDIALGTFLDEYAKITSGSTGGQGSTDASRREAYDRLSKYATQGQLSAGIATMKQEMGNRITGLDKEIADTTAKISGKSADPPHSTGVAPISGTTPQQEATRKQFQNTGKPAGDQGNPYVPRSKAEFGAMKSGTWFINPADGRVMQKK